MVSGSPTTHLGDTSLDWETTGTPISFTATHLRRGKQAIISPKSVIPRVLDSPLDETHRVHPTIDESHSFPSENVSLGTTSFEPVGDCYNPGYSEPEPGDSSLRVVPDTLISTYREALSPIPLPTYLGENVFRLHDPGEASRCPENSGVDL